jgi:hypothetical protein
MWRTHSGSLSKNCRYTQYVRGYTDIDTKGSYDLILNWKKHRVSSAEPECESVNHTTETPHFSISISLCDLAIAFVHIAVSQLHQLKHLCRTIIQLPFLQFPIPGPNIDRLRSGRSGTDVCLELWGGGAGVDPLRCSCCVERVLVCYGCQFVCLLGNSVQCNTLVDRWVTEWMFVCVCVVCVHACLWVEGYIAVLVERHGLREETLCLDRRVSRRENAWVTEQWVCRRLGE